MARLNEPAIAPPASSADSIDAVRRRFLRQNRELAKTNSQQSVRIRSLENDAARLLTENLSLREQVLSLQNALEMHASGPSMTHIFSVRDRLETKMQEIAGLVEELNKLGNVRDVVPRCKSQLAATRRSPDERQWRSGLGLQEVENAMMPTIAEDKLYPRRTLDIEEVQGAMDDGDSQSPDIGPPPVSRIPQEEPSVLMVSPSSTQQSAGVSDAIAFELPITLETRRKRRESGPRSSIRWECLFDTPPKNDEQVTQKSTRFGAKRKFSVSEDDEGAKAPLETSRARRRDPALRPVSQGPYTKLDHVSQERSVLCSSKPSIRKVEPGIDSHLVEPVNTDPVVSPQKNRLNNAEQSSKAGTVLAFNDAQIDLSEKLSVQRPSKSPIEPELGVTPFDLDALPPETPAISDMLSPPVTEPSTGWIESQDTPPPGNLSSIHQLRTGTRPSRRARPQGSYKEPSLHTKLRRPGKELVDAVTCEQQHPKVTHKPERSQTTARALTSQAAADDPITANTNQARNQHAEEEEATSPLLRKMDRREQPNDGGPEAARLNSAVASNAISALIEENRRKSAMFGTSIETAESQPSKIRLEDDAELAVYDFEESSTPEAPLGLTSQPRINLAKAARSARRHSSTPAIAQVHERKVEVSATTNRKVPSVLSKPTAGTKCVPDALNLVSVVPRGEVDGCGQAKVAQAASSSSLRAVGVRAERAASRRRSMLL